MNAFVREAKMKKLFSSFIVLFCFLGAHGLWAEKKVYTAQPVNPHPPVIDGKLDDPVWKKLEWGTDFTQRQPQDGEPPSQQTAFKIAYDNDSLYVGIRAYDSEAEKIACLMSRRDTCDGDWLELAIDSYHDLRTAFSFAVNAAGVKADETITNDGGYRDLTWDPIWYVKTSTDSQGWTAEMKIPWSQLRFADQEELVWGLQVGRKIYSKNETSYWQPMPQKAPGWVNLYGELRGIKGIRPQRMVQILPYTMGRLQTFAEEQGNPFATGRLSSFMGGVDGKIGITNDLTLDFTVNPDFGQVEADPSVMNLTAFETYFQEKRPFFIEGRNILDYQITSGGNPYAMDNLLYSRRIGRVPHYSPSLEDDEYSNMPDNTTILGALKLTGKTQSGLSIGIMESITAKESATIDYLGQRRSQTVEPLTNYFVLRAQKDIQQGNTIIGGMFTATNRSITDDHLDYLHKAAYTGGFDFYHTWKEKTYYFFLNTVFSRVQGSTEALLETQESSVHYFQRPDAPHVAVDPNRTSLFGHGGTFSFGKQGGKHWVYSTGASWRSPGLELNDMGYLYTADIIFQWTWAQYRIMDPFSIFNRVFINFNQYSTWNFEPINQSKGGNINLYTQFKNHWGFGSGLNRDGKELSPTLLRGGPAMRLPGAWYNWFEIHSNEQKRIRFNIGSSNGWGDEKHNRFTEFWGGVTYKPNSALSIGIHPSYYTNKSQLQYVDTLDLDEGEKYIFGHINQKTLSLTIRMNLSITPDLSIQVYGQPFVSTGDYTAFKQITSPRAKAYADRFEIFADSQISYDPEDRIYSIDENQDGLANYSFDDPDFHFLELRANLIIRWEYIPGSTLYLVWTQGRTNDLGHGRFSFFNNLQDLFSIHPHNVFLVKFTYNFKT